MKRIIYKSLTLSFIIILMSSCDNLLDISPRNSIEDTNAIKTAADVEALVVSAYDALADGDLLGGNILRDSELLGDDGEIFWDGTFVAPGEIFAKSILINNTQVEATWLAGFNTINICNLALANLELVAEVNQDLIEGQAKFVRAVAFFELVKMYAETWTDGDPTENPGLPIPLTPTTLDNVGVKAVRRSVDEVYTQIINDLEDAYNLLPEENGFYATTYSAAAMLSRVYLQQNNYALARDYANIVITSGFYELTGKFSDAFNKTSIKGQNATLEDVFAIQITTQDGVNNMNTFFADADFGGRNDVFIEDAHFDIYEPGDTRGDMFYFGYSSKFNNQFGNIPFIRLAEMYLTRAEANFRLSTAIGAGPVDDINTIRNRAGLADLAVALTLDEILLERRRELAFEGHLIHDIKRTQRSVGALPFNADELVYPIPLRETLINPELGQNDGY